jgi:hypothetical protein
MKPLIVKNSLSKEATEYLDTMDKPWQKGGFTILKKDKNQKTYEKNFLSNDRRVWRTGLQDCPEIIKELEDLFKTYNKGNNHINLTEGNINAHLLEYREEDVGFLTEHQDVFYIDSDVRKLSMTIQLNDNFSGGELFIMGTDTPLEKNDAVIFPSFIPHGVNPVTKGNRRVLIAWAFGPHWQ